LRGEKLTTKEQARRAVDLGVPKKIKKYFLTKNWKNRMHSYRSD
jgi:hypothetical protein